MVTRQQLTVAISAIAVATVAVLYTEPTTVFETVPALARVTVSVSTPVVILGIAVLVAAIVGVQRFSRSFSLLESGGDSLVDNALERTALLESGVGTMKTPNKATDNESTTGQENSSSHQSEPFLQQESNGGLVDQFGSKYDKWLRRAVDYDRSVDNRARNRSELRERLREEAVIGCQMRTDADTTTARAVVDAGTWTDIPRAGGFLAGSDGQSIPIRLWLWDVLRGADPFEEAVEDTLTALEAVYVRGNDADSDTVAIDLEAAIAAVDDDATEPSARLVDRLRARTNVILRGTSSD